MRLYSVCPKTRCLDGKIQFRGVLKKMIVRFTGVNERLFFWHNDEMEFSAKHYLLIKQHWSNSESLILIPVNKQRSILSLFLSTYTHAK